MAKVEQLYNKNQFVIYTDKGTYFQSYDSVIAHYYKKKLSVTPLWDYSNTTRKHFYIFLKEHTTISFPYECHNKKKYILDLIESGKIEVVKNGSLDF